MKSSEIRSRFLKFFEKRGHAVIESASLVTPDEKGITNPTLFNTAGMQPLIPYLLGKDHPKGKRLVDVQKCVRTVDIDDIGDKTHATFFEMLGNWSLGDYFKKEAIQWSYEFLTSKEEGLGLDPKRLYVTVFEGNENAGKDNESAEIWKGVGMPENRIYFKDASANWWPAVKADKKDSWTGPTGPCSEMFYDITERGLGDLSPEQFDKADGEQKIVEIWNDVFMEFEKVDGKIVSKLTKKNVDTGAGFERLCMVMQKVDNIFDTDLLMSLMEQLNKTSKNWNLKSARIVADHIRASIFLIADGVIPDKDGRGYVLRKLIRRAVRHANKLGVEWIEQIGERDYIKTVIEIYKDVYKNLKENEGLIRSVILKEEGLFKNSLEKGLNLLKQNYVAATVIPKGASDTEREFEINKSKEIPAKLVFDLYQSYGFPIELTKEILSEDGIAFDEEAVMSLVKHHQSLSRSGAEKKFKGGLADTSEMSVKYHTATHLLHQALHDVLGEGVMQKGSNITPERLRFDFSHGAKMTDEEKKKVEDIVNKKIEEALPMNNVVMSKEEAEKTGARHFFGEKYGSDVSIYYIGKDLKSAYSKEFCGGPHVKNTSELGKFKIQKEEAVSQGIRRIKAILE